MRLYENDPFSDDTLGRGRVAILYYGRNAMPVTKPRFRFLVASGKRVSNVFTSPLTWLTSTSDLRRENLAFEEELLYVQAKISVMRRCHTPVRARCAQRPEPHAFPTNPRAESVTLAPIEYFA